MKKSGYKRATLEEKTEFEEMYEEVTLFRKQRDLISVKKSISSERALVLGFPGHDLSHKRAEH